MNVCHTKAPDAKYNQKYFKHLNFTAVVCVMEVSDVTIRERLGISAVQYSVVKN